MTSVARPQAGPAAQSPAGFSLLEMIVALALAALVGALVLQSARGARQGPVLGERAVEMGAMRAAQSYIRSVLGQARSISQQTGEELSFDGNERGASFLSTFVPAGAYAGLYRVEVTVEPSLTRAGRFDLVARQRLHRAGAEPNDQALLAVSTRIVENITDARLSYFAKTAKAPDGEWLPGWQHATDLPPLVALTVTFPSGDPRVWPRMNVPLTSAAVSAIVCPPRVPCR